MLWQRQRAQHADGSVSETAELKPVAEIVEVPEKYELAMEAALGSRLTAVGVRFQRHRARALDYLKSNTKGRSSFVAGDWMGWPPGEATIS